MVHIKAYWEYNFAIYKRAYADTRQFVIHNLPIEGLFVLSSAVVGGLVSPFDLHAVASGLYAGLASIGLVILIVGGWNFAFADFRIWRELGGSSSPSDAIIKAYLKDALKRGDAIHKKMDGRNLYAFDGESTDWFIEVAEYLDNNLPEDEAFVFRTIDREVDDNDIFAEKIKMDVRLRKLRLIIARTLKPKVNQ